MYQLIDIEDEWAYLTIDGQYGAVSLYRGSCEQPDGTELVLPDEKWIAACRLAGAAPELLAVCRYALTDLECAYAAAFPDGNDDIELTMRGLRSAINKATGRVE